MNAIIDDLTEEHDAIQLMLRILGHIAEDFENKREVPEQHLEGLADFFTIFADKCHHGKEEKLLFPALIEKGADLSDEPFKSILEEHQIGKTYINNMLDSIETYQKSRTDMGFFVENARKYRALLTDHIELENDELFRITREYFSDEEQAELKIRFDEFEEDVIGGGVHDELHEMIDGLRSYYLT